jgi:TATA-box binding protein (TBP) (component of TFIID and TFIIIB)
MIATETKSSEDSNLAIRKYARIIQVIRFLMEFNDLKIKNIVDSITSNLRLICNISSRNIRNLFSISQRCPETDFRMDSINIVS